MSDLAPVQFILLDIFGLTPLCSFINLALAIICSRSFKKLHVSGELGIIKGAASPMNTVNYV